MQQEGTQFRIVARLAGYEDAHATVTVRPDEAVPVNLTLKQTRPPAIPPHTITGKAYCSRPAVARWQPQTLR